MPSASAELFSIAAATPDDARGHAGAALSAKAGATAALRRGIDLSAHFDIDAHADASIRDVVHASITGGARGRLSLALQAMVPLDLFHEAGIVARFRAQAEAAAYVRAAVGLDSQAFASLVTSRFDGPMRELCEIFLDEVVVEAGVWARAAFAAEIVAEAALTGSLLGTSDGGAPGFSFSARYGVGYAYGAGVDFLTNVGVDDPHRLLNRLSDRLTSHVVAAAEAHVRGLTGTNRRNANEALAYLRILLPLAGRGAFEVGMRLAQSATEDAQREASRAIVESFVAEAQEFLLRAVFDLGLAEVRALWTGDSLADAYGALGAPARSRVVRDLGALRAALLVLDAQEHAAVADWVAALVGCLEPAEALIEDGLLAGQAARQCERALALAWSAGVLLSRVAAWTSASAEVFPATVVAPVPDNSLVAAHVATAIGKPAGSGLTLADLADFLVGSGLLPALRAADPTLASAVGWLEAALAALPGHDLVKQLLVDLAPPSDAATKKLLSSMGKAFGTAIEQKVIPHLFEPIKRANPEDEMLATLLDGVAAPTLVALPSVTLAWLGQLKSEEQATRFREALSAIVLQSVAPFLLQTVDVLLEHALSDGERAIRGVARDIGSIGETAPGFAALAAVASTAVLPFALTPADVEGILVLCADLAKLLNDEEREPLIEAATAVASFGLGSGGSRAAVIAKLMTSDAVPRDQDLKALLERIEKTAWDVAVLVVPRVLLLVGEHFVHEVELIARAVYEGAKALVKAVEDAIVWLAQQLDALKKKLGELVATVGRLVGEIAGAIADLAQHVRQLKDDAVDAVRALGWSIAAPIVSWAPACVQAEARKLYDALFDSIKWALDLPLKVLHDVGTWVHDALTAQVAAGAFSRSQLDQAVHTRILSSAAPNLTIDLTLDLGLAGKYSFGKVTIAAGDVLGTIASIVLGDGTFGNAADVLVGKASTLRATQAQQQQTQAAIDGVLTKQDAQAAVASLSTGKPLSIALAPGPGSVHEGRARVDVKIAGANRSFVESTLGVPRRVRLLVNGEEYVYAPEQWTVAADGIRFSAYVAPTAVGLAPEPVTSNYRFSAVKLPAGSTITLDAGSDRAFRVAPPATLAPSPPVAVPRRGGDGRLAPTVSESLGGVLRADLAAIPRATGGTTTVRPGADTLVVATPTTTTPATPAEEMQGWRWAMPTAAPDGATLSGAPMEEVLPVIVGRPGINVIQVAASDGKAFTDHAAATFVIAA